MATWTAKRAVQLARDTSYAESRFWLGVARPNQNLQHRLEVPGGTPKTSESLSIAWIWWNLHDGTHLTD